MLGIVESILIRRYGEPLVFASGPFTEYRWNDKSPGNQCVLYQGETSESYVDTKCDPLKAIYGTSIGGFLIGIPASLKIAAMSGTEIFGLARIDELQRRPEVRRANLLDPGICFFMDAANVWFYGVKEDQIYVYDSATDELDSQGPLQVAIEEVMTEWEQAKAKQK